MIQRRTNTNCGRAFTLVELLMAAATTAVISIASATFVSAVSNATLSTRDIKGTQVSGQFVLNQFTKTVHESRAIGQATTTAMVLWLGDANNDDKINLYETGIIRYDSSNSQICFDRMVKDDGSIPATTVTTAQFKSLSTMQGLFTGTDYKTVVWVSNATSMSFSGNPSTVDMRVAEINLALTSGTQSMTFEASASPRAPADYLFYSQTQKTPMIGSVRKIRSVISVYDGISTNPVLSTVSALADLL